MKSGNNIIFSELDRQFMPLEAISDVRLRSKWCSVRYKTGSICGVMLCALPDAQVPPLTLVPCLCGWYEIYIGLYNVQWVEGGRCLRVSLSGDSTYQLVSPSPPRGFEKDIDEFYWRSADMTGKSLTIEHPDGNSNAIAFLRFVPLDDKQAADLKNDFTDPSHKRIFAAEDIHNMLYSYKEITPRDWRSVTERYRDSDVFALSMEYIGVFDGKTPAEDSCEMSFPRKGDFNVYKNLKKFILGSETIYPTLIRNGHEINLKMFMSLRMGAWNIEFPFNQMYFDNRFFLEHPEWRCIDRDGDPIDRLSYAYPEVQEYILNYFDEMVGFGCDGVVPLFIRYFPYILFEQPVIDAFKAAYPGINPLELLNEDERLMRVRSEYMTGFMRRLRACVGKNIKIVPGICTSITDNLYFGLDIAAWIKEGLVDGLVVDPDKLREQLPPDVFTEDGRVSIERYREWVLNSPDIITQRNLHDHNCTPEEIREYMNLTEGTDIKVYFDLLPRSEHPDKRKERALYYYNSGAENFASWDAYSAQPQSRNWTLASRIGHKETLSSINPAERYRTLRITRLGGKDMGRFPASWGG